MTESESMYYLHTCLSHTSIQPLLAFVGTTITKGIPETSFNPYPAKWSRSVQGVVHDLKHIWTEPLANRKALLDNPGPGSTSQWSGTISTPRVWLCAQHSTARSCTPGELLPPTLGHHQSLALSGLLAWHWSLPPVGSGELMLLFQELQCLKIL